MMAISLCQTIQNGAHLEIQTCKYQFQGTVSTFYMFPFPFPNYFAKGSS